MERATLIRKATDRLQWKTLVNGQSPDEDDEDEDEETIV